VLLCAVGLALGLGDGRARAAKPPLCGGGVLEVDAAASPLVPGGAAPDLLRLGDDGVLSIASGCPEIAGKLRSTRKGTKLTGKWTKRTGLCEGLPKRASLRARFDASCDVLTGTFVTKGRKHAFRATRAGVVLDGLVPASIRGERLLVGRATGSDLLAADARWADVLAALGASADSAEIATSAPLPGSALDLHAGAWTAPGAGWAQRVSALAAGIAAHPASGYVSEERILGGRSVWKVTVPADPQYAATYYAVDGDTLVLLTSGDEALVDEVIAELAAPSAAAQPAGGPRGGDPPLPGGSLLAVLLMRPVEQPVCVAEPYGRVTIDLWALDGYYQVPVPASFVVLQLGHGETSPLVGFGPAVSFFYKAVTYVDPEQLMFQAVAPAGGQGVCPVSFPVRHCLNGTWADRDRVLAVHQLEDHVTADLDSGLVCDEAGGLIFSGDMITEERFEGSDLKVCAPPVCVEAGLLEASARRPYTAIISPDGSSVEFSWESVQFDLVYDDGGQLVGCPPNGDLEPRSFPIQRLSFGPSVP
jgi:hypothetical protein